MRYVGTRNPRAEHNPLRSLPLLRPASVIARSTENDLRIGELRRALYAVDGWARAYAAARADLGRANRSIPQYRRANQADAMRALNQVRAAMRANLRTIAQNEVALLAAGVAPSAWAVAGRA